MGVVVDGAVYGAGELVRIGIGVVLRNVGEFLNHHDALDVAERDFVVLGTDGEVAHTGEEDNPRGDAERGDVDAVLPCRVAGVAVDTEHHVLARVLSGATLQLIGALAQTSLVADYAGDAKV